MRERIYGSTILDLGTRWRWVVCFKPLPLHPREKSAKYPLARRLVGSRSGRCGEESKLAPAENQNPAVHPLARRHTDSTQ
jgi:hypothetical protein